MRSGIGEMHNSVFGDFCSYSSAVLFRPVSLRIILMNVCARTAICSMLFRELLYWPFVRPGFCVCLVFSFVLEMGFHCRGLTGFELTVDQAGLELKKFASQMLGLKA